MCIVNPLAHHGRHAPDGGYLVMVKLSSTVPLDATKS